MGPNMEPIGLARAWEVIEVATQIKMIFTRARVDIGTGSGEPSLS